MFSHKCYLKLGDHSGTDIMSLMKSGYEIASCEFSFEQGIDNKGKPSTEVFGGTISITLPLLPPNPIIEWAMNSRKYQKGVIVVFDEHDVPQEKVMFENAACIDFGLQYNAVGESSSSTMLVIQAERLTVGTGNVDFDNFWTK